MPHVDFLESRRSRSMGGCEERGSEEDAGSRNSNNVRFTVGATGWEVWNRRGECLGEVENIGPKTWVIHSSGKTWGAFPSRKAAGEELVRRNVSLRDIF